MLSRLTAPVSAASVSHMYIDESTAVKSHREAVRLAGRFRTSSHFFVFFLMSMVCLTAPTPPPPPHTHTSLLHTHTNHSDPHVLTQTLLCKIRFYCCLCLNIKFEIVDFFFVSNNSFVYTTPDLYVTFMVVIYLTCLLSKKVPQAPLYF